jgi:hypothetical protein
MHIHEDIKKFKEKRTHLQRGDIAQCPARVKCSALTQNVEGGHHQQLHPLAEFSSAPCIARGYNIPTLNKHISQVLNLFKGHPKPMAEITTSVGT